MKEKNDLRVIKTRKNLYEALLYLLKDKTFEEIKVSDICEKALINRSTFYAHYNDKYELFADLIEDLKSSLAKELSTNSNISNSKEYYLEMLKIFLDHVEKEKDIYNAIIIHNQNSVIIDMVYDTLKEDIKNRLAVEKSHEKNNIPRDIIAKFYLGAVLNVGTEWLKNPSRYSKQDIINYLEILIPENI